MKILLIGLAGAFLLLWLGFRPTIAADRPVFFGEAPDAGDLPLLQSLETSDPAAAARWFETRLGFAEIARAEEAGRITLERGAMRLVLSRRDRAAAIVRDTLRLSLDEAAFDSAIETAEQAGERILWSARDRRRDGLIAAHVEGPDGHRIVLVRNAAAAPAIAKRKRAAASAG